MAGRIPQDFLDQLLSRIDIVELIDNRVPLRKAGRDYQACCPFHNEKTPSFTVSPEKQFFHCFGCGAHGNAISFLMDYERLEFRDAVEELARSIGMEPPGESTVAGAVPATGRLLALLQQADRFFRHQLREHPQRQRAIDYLRRRGLEGVTVRDFGIGYAPPGWDNLLRALTESGAATTDLVEAGLTIARDSGGAYDRFRDRIMFPIRDRRGRTIAFGGRALDEDNPPKYLNSPESVLFHKGRQLYGLFEALQHTAKPERLLVVEGYMDVIALAQQNLRYAVATLGTATTPDHLERLFRVTPTLVFCFDGDRAGRDAAWRALENTLPLLRDGRQVRYLFLPEGDDPDSLVRREGAVGFEQCLEQAQPLPEYFFSRLSAQIDADSLDGRARLAERVRPLLARLPEGAYRTLMEQALTERVGLSSELVDSYLARQRRASAPAGAQPVKLTLLRRAIALVLQYPDLARWAPDYLDQQRWSDVPGLDLLKELIDLARRHPHITTGRLLEHFRGSEQATIVARLAQADLQITPDTDHKALFMGDIDKIRQTHLEPNLYDQLARGELDAHSFARELERIRRAAQPVEEEVAPLPPQHGD